MAKVLQRLLLFVSIFVVVKVLDSKFESSGDALVQTESVFGDFIVRHFRVNLSSVDTAVAEHPAHRFDRYTLR